MSILAICANRGSAVSACHPQSQGNWDWSIKPLRDTFRALPFNLNLLQEHATLMRCDAHFVSSDFRTVEQAHAPRPSFRRVALLLLLTVVGCGTTRTSDTLRTGTEQLLLSTAIERAINDMDFSILAGKEVYFDPQYLKGVADEGYIVSSMRQRLVSEGVLLTSTRDEATYVVEARAGAVGTNHQDVLIGVPQVSLPTGGMVTGVPSAIPEIPLAKKTHQRGIVKLAAFAFNQKTGQGVWQSGTYPITADARDTWVLGTGPFQRGSIYAGTGFVGQGVGWFGRRATSTSEQRPSAPGLSITAAGTFEEDPELMAAKVAKAAKAQKEASGVTPAAGSESKTAKPNPQSFVPAVLPSQPQPGRVPTPDTPATSASAQSSGFTPTSSTSATNSTNFANSAGSTSVNTSGSASGGNAAAAGLMILRQQGIGTQH